MSDVANEVRCLLAPIEGGWVLLPGSVIAEVGSLDGLNAYARPSRWLLGSINWKDWHVPVVSYTVLGGIEESDRVSAADRVLVIKSLNETSGTPYLGIKISGVPSMARITPGDLESPKPVAGHAAVFRVVTMDQAEALIPDLDKLSALVEKALEKNESDSA